MPRQHPTCTRARGRPRARVRSRACRPALREPRSRWHPPVGRTRRRRSRRSWVGRRGAGRRGRRCPSGVRAARPGSVRSVMVASSIRARCTLESIVDRRSLRLDGWPSTAHCGCVAATTNESARPREELAAVRGEGRRRAGLREQHRVDDVDDAVRDVDVGGDDPSVVDVRRSRREPTGCRNCLLIVRIRLLPSTSPLNRSPGATW